MQHCSARVSQQVLTTRHLQSEIQMHKKGILKNWRNNCSSKAMLPRLHLPLLLLFAIQGTVSCVTQAEELQKGITFSHMYKIESGCKQDSQAGLLSQDQASDGQVITLDKENDIVFKHNIRLSSPSCNCAGSEEFKALLYRVNGLEEEVTYLKSQCAQGCCKGSTGVDPSCSGHGVFQHGTCSCKCDAGWGGPDCSISSCPDDCNDNGYCVDGKCVCHASYMGHDCSLLMCPNDCNDKGHCVDGKCVCFEDFTGDNCDVQLCPSECNKNGLCVDGQCLCDEGFFGYDCSTVLNPKGLHVIKVTDVSLLVGWEHVKGAEYYMLSYYPDENEGAIQKIQVPNTENSYLVTGLKPGVTYIVQVYAVIKDISSESDHTMAKTDLSGVEGIQVIGQTEDSIQVDWKNPETEVDFFRLHHASPDGHEELENVVMSQEARTMHTIIGLNPGTEYQITVQAIKGSSVGKPSHTTGHTDIDSPTNLAARDVTETSATVTWEKVRAEIDGYILKYTSADGSSQEFHVRANATSYRFTSLKPGVRYTFTIWGYKGSRSSRKSSVEAETELDAPTNLLAKEVTKNSARVSWERVQADIDDYVLSYSSSDGSREEVQVGSDTTTYSLTALRPGLVYTVYVWAIKGSRISKKDTTEFETDLDAPTNLLAREVMENSAVMSWDRAQAEVDGYVLSYSTSGGPYEEVQVGEDTTTHSLTALRPGVVYTVYIQATKGSRSSKKATVEIETEIDAPKNLQAVDVQMESSSLTWEAPQADIEGYTLSYRLEDGSMQAVEKKLPAGDTTFSLSGLDIGKQYIVTLFAYRGSKMSKLEETTFSTVGNAFPFPMDCTQIKKNGVMENGVYTIYVANNRSKPIEVYCDMITDGGGWIVFQRRLNGKLDFRRGWRQYIQGFGELTYEFWLGLEKIYELTNTPTKYEVRFDLGLGEERAYAVYDNFKVGQVKQKFKLTVGNYSGNAGDAMTYHQGCSFTTVDSDNDIALGNCALTHHGAWWYQNCHLANLNGKFGDNRHSMGMNWKPWKGHLTSLDFSEIKIRPVGTASRKKRSLKRRAAA